MDRIQVSGTWDVGSIPTEGTIAKISSKKYRSKKLSLPLDKYKKV